MKVAVIGLGYVGLPLAVEIAKKYVVVGFDINENRINKLIEDFDETGEVVAQELKESALKISYALDDIAECDFYIVTVPTPVDNEKKPDLTILTSATRMIAPLLKKKNVVVYESTVFPGCTEEVCVPILEKGSGLKYNDDFFCGYSPERINPGDKEHRVSDIKKVTSGSNSEIAKKIDDFYKSIITAGTHLASSIKVAEAAKAIENAQRDINIAFVNELAIIFEKMNVDTHEVLKAAGTKWNFLNFTPGLVGGHCIGVDPYYLSQKSVELGYTPEIILSGRKINDGMGPFVAQRVLKLLAQQKVEQPRRVLIMGITFKEDCPDIRNTRVIDIVDELQKQKTLCDVYDPQANPDDVKKEYGLTLIVNPQYSSYSAIILAVSHKQFLDLSWEDISSQCSIIFDVKGILPVKYVTSRL